MTNTLLNIEMMPQTLNALHGYSIFSFQAVQSSIGGAPILCSATPILSEINAVATSPQFQALLFPQGPRPNQSMMADFSATIGLGQMLQVTGPQAWQIVQGGGAGSIWFENQTSQPVTCGIAQMIGKLYQATFAGELAAGASCAITPLQTTFVVIAKTLANVGTVIEQCPYAGLLADLSGSNQVLTVTYDATSGWETNGNAALTQVAAGADLTTLLVESVSAVA